MENFKKLTRENQLSVIRLWEVLSKKEYDEFERRMSKEEYEKCINQRKKDLKQYRKIVKS